MAGARNPFTPTFGIVPPFLAGCDDLLDSFDVAFGNGVGGPYLCTLLIGPRGSGKTALLSRIGDEAREHGWIVVDAVAEKGMLEDIIQHAKSDASEVVEKPTSRRLSGVSLGDVVGLEWEIDTPEAPSWRMRMEALLSELAQKGIGLLITVDEVNVDVEEMVRLVSAYQLFVRNGFNVALVMAGLPAHVTNLIGDGRVSFLRRARQRHLGTIPAGDVSRAFRKTVERGGKRIGDDALEVAVEAAQGFPYMMQLVGYFMWAESDEAVRISRADAQRGSEAAKEDFRVGVLERTWREMSKGDRTFAVAMLPDDGDSTLTEVAKRMGRGTNYASTYKKRLMNQGVIGERAGDTFDFDIPLMRDYLSSI